jgi:predicted flap endonuclease-1-like 5' DNA nuclease
MTTGPAKVIYALVAVCALAATARASNYALEEIPQAIPAADAQRLKGQGIGTTFQLLEKAGEPKARRELAKAAKIKGIGPDVTRLLAACGVHTVAQLKTQDATKLNDEIMKANSKSHLSENPPSVEHLQAWIAQAQTLPIVLH